MQPSNFKMSTLLTKTTTFKQASNISSPDFCIKNVFFYGPGVVFLGQISQFHKL